MTYERAQALFLQRLRDGREDPLEALANDPKNWLEIDRPPTPAELQAEGLRVMGTGEPYIGPAQTNIPLPPSKRGDGSLGKAISELKVGESFETQYSTTAIYRWAQKYGYEIVCRKRGGGHVRAWRIA